MTRGTRRKLPTWSRPALLGGDFFGKDRVDALRVDPFGDLNRASLECIGKGGRHFAQHALDLGRADYLVDRALVAQRGFPAFETILQVHRSEKLAARSKRRHQSWFPMKWQ